MGGKRKRKLVAPGSSINKTPRPLPTRYDFVSKATTSNLPPVVLPNNNPAPSVRDYPPPRQLFPSSTFPPSGSAPVPQTQPPTRVPQSSGGEGTSYPQPGRRQSQSPPLEESPSSPLHGAPSPHSSQAQNSHGDPEDFAEFEAPVEPDLSEDVMDVLNRMLAQPGREELTTVLSPKLEPGTTWFGYDKSSLTRRITKIMKKKFNKPFYSWTCVPRDRQEGYFVEFAKKHTWNPMLTGLVQEHFEFICQLRMKGMVSDVRTSRDQPNWIGDTLWKQMTAYWDTEAAVAKSRKASAARLSERNGLGIHKHNSGQKSYMQLEQELIEELGRPVSFGEVFIKAHTRKDGTYVDFKAEKVAEAYKKKKEEKLADLRKDNTEISEGLLLAIEEDNELFIQSTFCNDRGDLFGIGSLKKKLKRKRNDPSSSYSFMHMQQKLEEAELKIKEQEARIAKAEADRALEQAINQAKMAEFSILHKYMRLTDQKYLDFIASEASSPAPPDQ
ncbi:uncharacterized protein LOC117132468 isoform X1 [Brassica rapa]|uniref:uncharacterized protein LOC117132468 isoform X1 n=1 Tax=Brassica campestris TaxID=3711 RepID=UPI00142D31C5|nr:uncharacterized protein LOC117132468 isoform X1 [Brassica rapa]